MNKNNNMKSLFFFLVLATSLSLNAQITKGNWMVGGDASFSSVTSHDENGNRTQKSSGIRVYPNIGCFFTDKLAIGLTPSFFYFNTKGGGDGFGYGIGPYARFYFLKLENRINVFADANYIYFYSDNGSSHNSSYTIKTGFALFFNNSVALELSLGYNSDNFSTVTNRVYLGLGFQIHLEK